MNLSDRFKILQQEAFIALKSASDDAALFRYTPQSSSQFQIPTQIQQPMDQQLYQLEQLRAFRESHAFNKYMPTSLQPLQPIIALQPTEIKRKKINASVVRKETSSLQPPSRISPKIKKPSIQERLGKTSIVKTNIKPALSIQDRLGKTITDRLDSKVIRKSSLNDRLGKTIQDRLGKTIQDRLGKTINERLGKSLDERIGKARSVLIVKPGSIQKKRREIKKLSSEELDMEIDKFMWLDGGISSTKLDNEITEYMREMDDIENETFM